MAHPEPGTSMMEDPEANDQKTILEIPIELLEEIISYATYDQISHMRQVNKTFNTTCSRLLNRGFLKVEKYHSHSLKRVKSQLPRRESERRNHALARHCDVLSAIETRLSLLSMTFMKFMDLNLCCFIPGKVIDEIYRVLRIINNSQNPPRVHELLQELRDISSMAMEYFEEKIAPTLKLRLTSSRPNLTILPPSLTKSYPGIARPAILTPPTPRNERDDDGTRLMRKELRNVTNGCKKETQEIRNKLLEMEKRQNDLDQLVTELQKRIADQESKIRELTAAKSPDFIELAPQQSGPSSRTRSKRKTSTAELKFSNPKRSKSNKQL